MRMSELKISEKGKCRCKEKKNTNYIGDARKEKTARIGLCVKKKNKDRENSGSALLPFFFFHNFTFKD